MQKTTLPQGIRTLRNWYDKGTLTFDNPIQRSGSQWSLLQKSLLIHSILSGYPIPNCYFLKGRNANNEIVYDCLDAKQRITSIFDFIDDSYALHSATESVLFSDGVEYALAGRTFSELPENLKDEILGYRLSIFCLEDCSDEEVEEIFARLNNSTPLSPIQKCRSVMGSDLARWTKMLCTSEFFQQSTCMSLAQVRREADLETLLQGMLLLDSRQGEYDDWKAISTAEITKYCKYLRENCDSNKRSEIEEVITYLSMAFPKQHKFLKKSNVPMVIVLAKLASDNDIKAEDFKTFIDSFSSCVCTEYEANTGSGNIKRVKTEGRLVAITDAMSLYFDLSNLNVLCSGVSSNADSVPAVSESEEENTLENEKEQLISTDLSSDDHGDEDFEKTEGENENGN